MSQESGKRIKDLRLNASLSQTELGKQLNVSKSTVSAWENGRMPDEDAIKKRTKDNKALSKEHIVTIFEQLTDIKRSNTITRKEHIKGINERRALRETHAQKSKRR